MVSVVAAMAVVQLAVVAWVAAAWAVVAWAVVVCVGVYGRCWLLGSVPLCGFARPRSAFCVCVAPFASAPPLCLFRTVVCESVAIKR